ncbi:hypothetical protein BJX61DRAFT_449056 [Aspergillus egyptiacus]|nr:hypothetical protein BJX61DRAFT_449056 [Aspergillus egyptiacus]
MELIELLHCLLLISLSRIVSSLRISSPCFHYTSTMPGPFTEVSFVTSIFKFSFSFLPGLPLSRRHKSSDLLPGHLSHCFWTASWGKQGSWAQLTTS